MADFLSNCLAGPNFAATLLLGLVMLYWLMMIVTGIGVDGLDIDLDLDADVDVDAALSFGGIMLKWLNIGRVPLMVWLTIFALSMWVISVSIPLPRPKEDLAFWYVTLLVLRNGALALIPTKLLTHPLQGMFDTAEPNRNEEMVGRTGLARTEISPAKGQAEIPTEAAPLLISVRTVQGFIEKGSELTIVGFDSEANMHLVERANSKNDQEV